ncbi:endolytic transglycosylase MltG, partial [Thermanaerothrix sp.]
EIREGFARQGLSLYQGVILASIVEREGIVKEEYPLIASVFLNRLRAGMKLDSDPTVQYALGYDAHLNTWWKNPLKSEDFKINSPYNTYINAGLPPTPICNPGLEALQAVANPAQTSYYYFRAQCDQSGRHVFSETYEQHLSEACP